MTVPNKPLTGIKVLDFSRLFAGPFCTMLLGDLGADVVKVEPPEGDPIRLQGPPFYNGMSMGFSAVNRNKRSLCVNLKDSEDHRLILELARNADVIVENFRPGVMERLGLGPDDLMKDNPALVYTRISGMGATGPLKDKGAFDLTIQAQAGFMSITGDKNGPPIKQGTSVFDLVCGQYAKGAILAALYHRQITKQGTVITTSLYESVITFLADAGMQWLLTGTLREKMGSEHASMVPYRAYEAKDGWIVIGAAVQHHFVGLLDILGLSELADRSEFKTLGARVKNREELDALLAKAIIKLPSDSLVKALDTKGIPCAPVNTLDRVFSDEQTLARNMIVKLQTGESPNMPLIGSAVKFSSFNIDERWTMPPKKGKHKHEIINDWIMAKD